MKLKCTNPDGCDGEIFELYKFKTYVRMTCIKCKCYTNMIKSEINID